MALPPLRILIAESDGFSTEAAQELSRAGEVVLADLDRNGLLSEVNDADILWVRLRHSIDREVLARASRLRIIVTATTGLNHIDLDEIGRRGIRLLSLRGETQFLQDVRATAELTIGLLLALSRKIIPASLHARGGGWDRDAFKGHELHRKTAGIVGYGRLGRIVARYLKAFDIRILATDPHVDEASTDGGVEHVTLPALLRESDAVSLHVDLNEHTRSFFGNEQFAAMKSGALFINTARGELIDENALLTALETGRLGGAAVDVLTGECPAGMKAHPLVTYARHHDNLIITPHIGGCTTESMEKTELFLARKLYAELLSRAQIAGDRTPFVATTI